MSSEKERSTSGQWGQRYRASLSGSGAAECTSGWMPKAYNAFTRRWEELERSGARTLEVARRE